MTQKEISEFKLNIKNKLAMATEELHKIELTNDKTKRFRWRELKKIIRHYNSLLNFNFNE